VKSAARKSAAQKSAARADRPAAYAGTGLVGTFLELTVGPIAHGGHCVARMSTVEGPGRVVFVRHTLPGERIRAVVTEERRGYLRADAVGILDPSPDRVTPPCPYAGPSGCGGCDFQHVAPAVQGELKAAVVREQLARLARFTVAELDTLRVRVEPLPGGPLGWRSRVRYRVDGAGRLGFHRHRSHEVVPVDRCLIAHPAIAESGVTDELFPDADDVEVVASSGGDVAVSVGGRVISGPEMVRERAVGRDWTVPAGAFWQVHPAAPDTLAEAVVRLLEPRRGERAWDLYGGAGLFAAALVPLVGDAGVVTVVESDPRGAAAARRDLADVAGVRVVVAEVAAALADPRLGGVDLVVVDPPRAGLGRAVVEAVVGHRPRAVAYVSCDPAAFARDVATFRQSAWRLAALRAYDAFPMTHHVELVALLTPDCGGVV
jgi:tRNA/tmRNA/rRNA uracil-C5-methylase (TrmA/RlmC/RlmD family)